MKPYQHIYIFIIAALIGANISLYDFEMPELGGGKVKEWEKAGNEHLKLKTAKENIYSIKTINDVRCDELELNCTNYGEIVQYLYIKSSPDRKRTIKIKESKIKKIDKELLGTNDSEIELQEKERDYNYITYGDYSNGDSVTKVTENFVGVQFVKNLETNEWFELENPATTTISAFEEQVQGTSTISYIKKLLGLEAKAVTSTFYPDSTRAVTVDGTIRLLDTARTWSNSVNAVNGEQVLTSNQSYGWVGEFGVKSNLYIYLGRGAYLFDTSSIPDGDTISSATFSVYGYTKTDSRGDNPTTNIYSFAPASNTSLANGDFDAYGTTEYATGVTYSSFNTSGYNDYVLNATGIAAISKTGVTKFGMRTNYDATNSAPSTQAAEDYTYARAYISLYAGTDRDPKLVVVHSSASTAIPPDDGVTIFD